MGRVDGRTGDFAAVVGVESGEDAMVEGREVGFQNACFTLEL